MEHEGDGDTNCIFCTQKNPQRLGKGTGRVGNRRTNRYNPNYSTVKIGRNTKKSPGYLRWLVVTQNPVKDHQQTLGEKLVSNSNNKKGDLILRLCQRIIKKNMDHESDGGTKCNWRDWNDHKRSGKGSERVGNERTRRDHPNDVIVKIGQNSKKNYGDLSRLADTQTLIKERQLTLMEKTRR